MSLGNTKTRVEAAKEHTLAVTRNYISQPRLSKYFRGILGEIFSKENRLRASGE